MASTPTVSVIMTVYNGEQYVAAAVDSIRRQTLPDFEIVVIDDGSTDRTTHLLAGICAEDPRITVITGPRIGRGAALNAAWKRARGRYIANLDADDAAEPDRLKAQVAFYQAHSGLGLLGTACRVVNMDTGRSQIVRKPVEDGDLRRALLRRNPFVHSSIMMPRTILEATGGYDARLSVAIDYELWVRIAGRYRVANLPDVLTMKRVSPHSYFQRRIGGWTRMRTLFAVRWLAWRTLSRRAADLRHVFFRE